MVLFNVVRLNVVRVNVVRVNVVWFNVVRVNVVQVNVIRFNVVRFNGLMSFGLIFQRNVAQVNVVRVNVFRHIVGVSVGSLNGECLASYLSYFILCGSRSGSTKFRSTDPIWIRIHNTGAKHNKLYHTPTTYGSVPIRPEPALR